MPSKEEMLEGIKQEEQIRDQLPRPQFPHGNYVKRCNELASLIGVLPDLEGLKKQNPPLHEKLFNGPFTTASFRLQGFGSNPEVASKIIDEINQSTLK
jgi:dimethylaniline monooxygenase (N-oxide forming)